MNYYHRARISLRSILIYGKFLLYRLLIINTNKINSLNQIGSIGASKLGEGIGLCKNLVSLTLNLEYDVILELRFHKLYLNFNLIRKNMINDSSGSKLGEGISKC